MLSQARTRCRSRCNIAAKSSTQHSRQRRGVRRGCTGRTAHRGQSTTGGCMVWHEPIQQGTTKPTNRFNGVLKLLVSAHLRAKLRIRYGAHASPVSEASISKHLPRSPITLMSRARTSKGHAWSMSRSHQCPDCPSWPNLQLHQRRQPYDQRLHRRGMVANYLANRSTCEDRPITITSSWGSCGAQN
jgi:hypothetical protein